MATAVAPGEAPSSLARAFWLPVRAADWARLLYLRLLGPLARPLVRSRELRVAVSGSTLLVFAFAAATCFPLWLLALGPIVWGVPHVLSDVRYLWVRPGHHRRWPLWILAIGPLVVLSITSNVVWGLAGVAGAVLVARGAVWKKALALATIIPALALAYFHNYFVALIFAHAHNFIGVLLWWGWRKRAGKLHYLPLAVFALGSAAITLGLADPLVMWAGAFDPTVGGADAYYYLGSLAPPGTPTLWAARLVLLFAFAQTAHYIVWVRLVPEEDRPRETPRTFAASLRALRADFGWPLLALTFAVALGLAIWAAIDVFSARNGYLRAVLFHGHLEVIAAALWLLEGRKRA